MTMADTIAVMNGGRIEQLGDPATLYERPASTFVANFLGQSNLLQGTLVPGSQRDGMVTVRSHGLELEAVADHLPAGRNEVFLGVRPEKLRIGPDGGPNQLKGVVRDVSFTGVATHYIIELPWGRELTLVQQNDGSARARLGEAVIVSWAARHGFALDASQDADAGADLVDDHV